jgi:CheY-like chemotaxis protein
MPVPTPGRGSILTREATSPPPPLTASSGRVSVAQPASDPSPSSSGAVPTVKSRQRKILVIDDSEETLARIRRALEADGHEVLATSRAVGNARHVPSTDLCVIDYPMPGIDAVTVITSLRAAATSGAHACLFYLYTSDPAVARDYKKLGFDGCFTDKGSEDALVRQVRAVFRMLQPAAMKKRG